MRVFFLLLIATPALAATLTEPVPDSPQEKEKTAYYFGFGEKAKDAGHSVAPVVGYDPTFQFVVGGAYFYEGPRLSFGLDANTNFRGVYQAHLRTLHRFAESWDYQVKAEAIKGFDPYYGEGGETKIEDYRLLWGNRYNATVHLHHILNEYLTLGLVGSARVRTEGPSPEGTFVRAHPDETVAAIGLSATLDSRKDKVHGNDGVVINMELNQGLPGWNQPSEKPFTQLVSSLVVYKEVMNDLFPGVVAAFRVMGGTSLGTVPYAFKYKLGGADKLRGYLDNRFRGTKFYLQQTELRVPVWRMIGAAFALGFGDITDTEFTSPKMAYGVGIRIGLPPDWVSQIRVDAGFTKDQMGIFAEFGQTF